MTARILYVEDEEDYQILARRILGRAGLGVDFAETGAQALEQLKSRRPSLLILDINLPDISGFSLCVQVRQEPAWMDIPILMLTVRRRPEEWLQGFSCGANDYLSKPINPPELVERVVKCLERRNIPPPGQENAELGLIRAAATGNRAAYEVLIQKYQARLKEGLHTVIRNEGLIDDVVAHALALAYEKLGHFRGEASFYTWIYRIALNEALAISRRPGDVSLEELSKGDEGILPAAMVKAPAMEDALSEQETNHHALEALGRVPCPYRELLDLFFLKDLSYDDIALKLRIPRGTVMSRLFRARKLLQEAWHNR